MDTQDMTREELVKAMAELEEKLPTLKAVYDDKAKVARESLAALETAQKARGLAIHESGRAENSYRGANEQYQALNRALQDLEVQEANPREYPIVHSKIHGNQPVRRGG